MCKEAYERLLAEYRSTIDPDDLKAEDEMGSPAIAVGDQRPVLVCANGLISAE